MNNTLYKKRISKLLGFGIIVFLTLFETNLINKSVKAEKNLIAATEKDLYLYRQMGASYLCIASKADVDFEKGLGIASATFTNVIFGKHGGVVKGLGNKKLDEKRLYNSGTSLILGSAIKICPESIPNDIKKSYQKKLKQFMKKNKK